MIDTRIERDSMGELEVPTNMYYGASTERARRNFPISNIRFQRSFIQALGLVKKAAAEVNDVLGLLDGQIAQAIQNAAHKVMEGQFDDNFVVDVFQTGSGTSTNMNANEVIANLAIEELGGVIGDRHSVHPNDHVNKGQSSNDVMPTVMHIAAAYGIKKDLLPSMEELEHSLDIKSNEFWDVIKTGRTHLQDATPIRLGQEFRGYAGQVKEGRRRVEAALEELSFIALGGTAVGTGIGTHPEFPRMVIERLNRWTGITFRETPNHFQAQSTIDSVVMASGCMRTVAISMLKIANDIRWLGSGPRAGTGEIRLPEVQPGSSIMPGKVNPVIAESVTMAAARVIGNDTTITIAGQSGNFELNVMIPVAAYSIIESVGLLAASCRNFARQCISGIESTNKGPQTVELGLAICTALVPIIGYDAAANIAKEASKTGESVREVSRRRTTLTEEELSVVLNPLAMTEPSREDSK